MDKDLDIVVGEIETVVCGKEPPLMHDENGGVYKQYGEFRQYQSDGKGFGSQVRTPDGLGTVYMRVGNGSPLDDVIVDVIKENNKSVRKTYPVSKVQALSVPALASAASAAHGCHHMFLLSPQSSSVIGLQFLAIFAVLFVLYVVIFGIIESIRTKKSAA